ncbi:MAG: hypothetical protein U0L66_09535 [Acutalibacteraceae bacterium]|nr:hypothetical protein [Acutalibacteraceae bacterium]
MAVSGIADILGTLIFPTGPYYPGFTLTAVITYALYDNKSAVRRRLLKLPVLANAQT